MDPVTCFWVDPIPIVARSLRRYTSSPTMVDDDCPNGDYHQAIAPMGDIEKPIVLPGEYEESPLPSDMPDAPWPSACSCGYVFTDEAVYPTEVMKRHDVRQVNDDRYYSDGTGRWPYRHGQGLPPGAMFRAWWLEPRLVGPDGMSLGVVLPVNEVFLMDAPASDGGRWTRSGIAPKISCQPSIHYVGRWHGYLTDGVLAD